MVDLVVNDEVRSNLGEGFGRVKRGDEEEEDCGPVYVKEVAAVAAAEIDAMDGGLRG